MQEILKIFLPVFLAHACILAAMILIIRRLLLTDTVKAVEKIKQVEVEVRQKEEGLRKEIEAHEQEFERKRADAQADLERHREKSEKEVAEMREQVIADAQKEGERLIAQAKQNAEKFKQQLAQEMEEKSVAYGGEVFKLVFSDNVTEAVNARFIDELLDALEEIDAGSITVDTSDASFKASHPLPPEQKLRLQGLLKEKFGADIEVQETIQEDLIAGLVFKLGSLEIDGSLLNRYHEAAAEIAKSARA